jgi:hypothetical protein
MYMEANNKGILRVYTARRDGVLKGYAAFIVHDSSQYAGTITATQDTIFLEKDERRGFAGSRFIRFCEDDLRDAGVHLIVQTATFQRDFGVVLERMGYIPTAILYERRLI